MTKHRSLSDYAARRFRFAGNALLEFSDPFFAQIDKLKKEMESAGKHFVSFANYDYLGLANHPRIIAEAKRELDTLGVGALASRLVGGERSTHKAFEAEIAKFLGFESALTLVSGYLANVSTISWLMGKRDAIIIDELAHNSIVAGTDASDAEVIKFRHNDLEHLEHILHKRREEFRHVLVVAEGIYSMDGDTADLPRLLDIKEKHQVWLLLDEAHSLGVLGATGRGLAEHQGVDPSRIDLVVGTMSKTLASCGGYVCGRKQVIEWFRYTLPGFVYSVGLSPVILTSARTALKLMQEDESWRIGKLARNAEFFRDTAHAAGLSTGPAIGRGVVPILFQDSVETMWASQHLLEQGFYVPPIVQIGVPKDQPRLRFFISANHTEDEIRGVIAALKNMPPVSEEAHRIVAAAMAGA
ncbi:aminotransferase class I/II-fold pyridoxal phosphate-dependent enzyme [Methylocystis heyeri]|uniref:Aminotransferase class I/II-fold pyridoxal phosphate-dependent enzyme n=1 Tax=Methylocystis heyeri TaxID=391905 RepID=A0A6B8KC99_9HYPH|nr:aminotransferase class I/II-fold pyridoxal phosphate-dependent enzyme [Methylocystis heyeri]QGM45287.1 aminotransferase class I/II-fold pyridoxal phosphate-dependent enzyme [Methylocystis heyeri]